jgi:hypothetical protein
VRPRDDRSQPPPGTHYTDGLNAGQGAALTPSDFGTFDLENVRAWPKTVEIRVRVDFEMAELSAGNSFPSPARGEWSEDGRAVCEAEGNLTAPVRFQLELGASGRERLSQNKRHSCSAERTG